MELTRKELRLQRVQKRRAIQSVVVLATVSVTATTLMLFPFASPATEAAPTPTAQVLTVEAPSLLPQIQRLKMRTPASTLSAARDDFTATSVEEVQAIMRARLAEERSKNPLVKAAEGLTNSPVEPIHDPLENTVGFPLTEWYYSFEINAFKTATRPTHKGSDFMAASGTPIYSIADGEVTFVGDFGGYGNVMYVDSEVNGVKVQIRYAHMLTPTSLKVGESVTKGQELGPVGQTGQASAPHIHLEILQDGEYVDPAAWLAVNAA